MDNQEYLAKISQKPLQVAKGQKKFFTPNMIKVFGGLLVAVVLLISVVSMLGQSGNRAKTLAESLYTRMTLLADRGGAIDTYAKELYSSDLRAMSGTLRTNMSGVASDLAVILPDLGIAPSKISDGVMEDEEARIVDLMDGLEVARLNAVLDRTYSSEMTMEIAELLAMHSELFAKTSNGALRDLLNRSAAGLEALEIKFTDFTNSH